MLTVVHDQECSNAKNDGVGRSLLDEIVHDGARQMLAAALQAEAAAYIDAHAGEVDENGRRLVVRSGYHHWCDRFPASMPAQILGMFVSSSSSLRQTALTMTVPTRP